MEKILKYAAGLLSGDDSRKLESHLGECIACTFRVAHACSKMGDACGEIRALFYNRKLSDEKLARISSHIAICDACNDKYHQLVEEREDSVFDRVAAKLKYMPILDFRLPFEPLVEMSIMDKKDGTAKEVIYDLLSEKSLEVKAADTESGYIKVLLKSSEFSVSNVNVTIGKKTDKGFKPISSAVTSKRGIAEFLSTPELEGYGSDKPYTFYLSGIRKKDKKK
jgi:hypothetical protein